jgi:hypothetical protein
MRYLAFIPLIFAGMITGCLDRGNSGSSAPPAVNSSVTPDSFLTFVNQSLDINTEAYAAAYYAAVDPMDERTTLADWKTKNEFDAGEDVHVIFRDTKDLGYGRDMYAKSLSNGSVAFYVNNYVVQIEPGDASTYGPLNLDAAIEGDREYHIGTNAIEFSPDPNDPLGQKILKFFTFSPADANGVQRRLTAANLDGRGVKYMPMMCVVCHGGTLYPLRPDGSFDPIALKSPQLNMLPQHTFQFSPVSGYTETDQKDGIAAINQMVLNAYRESGMRANSASDQANWDSSFAEELVETTYGVNPGDDIDFPGTEFQADSVPSGWQQTAGRPGGIEVLYKQVIEPHCIGCHSLRGTQVAKNRDMTLDPDQHPNSVNFSSYEEFIGYNDLIIDYVYQRGAMPRSLINYSQFWDDPNGAPTLLATYLTGFDVFDANGNVVEPGRSVAKPGTDRTVASTPTILDATASLYTTTYAWRIVTSTDPDAVLDDTSSPAPSLTASDGSMVTLELVTSNAKGNSDPAQFTITVDSSFIPAEPTFVPDILEVLGNNLATPMGPSLKGKCIDCHSISQSTSGVNNDLLGIPVYYEMDSYDADDTDATKDNNKHLYLNVLNRIDLVDPENSLLLRKPTSLQHGGSVVLDRTDPVLDSYYMTILNWIRDGAPCGNDTTYCD